MDKKMDDFCCLAYKIKHSVKTAWGRIRTLLSRRDGTKLIKSYIIEIKINCTAMTMLSIRYAHIHSTRLD